MPESYRANISRDSNRPGARVETQTLRCGAGGQARLIEIALGDFGIRVWFDRKISFVAIKQRGKALAWLVIAQNALPFGIDF